MDIAIFEDLLTRESRLLRRLFFAALLLAPAVATAEPGGSVAPRSDHAARRAVARALEAMGAVERIRDAGGLVFRARGVLRQGAERQGLSPDGSEPSSFEETFAVDRDLGRVAYEYRHDRLDGTVDWVRSIFPAQLDVRTLLVLADGFAISLQSPEHRDTRRRVFRRIPHLLLNEALDGEGTLRSLGREGGRERVSWELPGREILTLFFESKSGILARVEYRMDVPTFGDATVTWTFDRYESVEGFGLFPRRYGVSLEGRPLTEMVVENVELGAPAVEAILRAPAGMEVPDPRLLPASSGADRNAEVREVAPGVFQVESLRLGFHVLFIELEDFVVAIDAPAGYPLLNELPASDVAPGPAADWLTRRYLELIRETVPDKPLRYVVLTHFHNDHAGGLRAFIAEGAVILAAPSARRAIEALARRPHTLAPDLLAALSPPPELKLEIVEGSRTIADDSKTIEILDVGENPHSRNMLAVHLPGEKIVYVSDLLTPVPVENFPTKSHERVDRFFVNWLDSRQIEPLHVYASHGNGHATREHLDKIRSGK